MNRKSSRIAPSWRRDDIVITVEVMTWDACVLRVEMAARTFVVCLPADAFDEWIARFESGALSDELRKVARSGPRRVLRRLPRSVRVSNRARPDRIGLEHEFEVTRDGDPVDFRPLMASMFEGCIRADPADPLATRIDGGVATADGREAEIATSPIEIRPGFAERAARSTESLRDTLTTELPTGHRLSGYSTHISISWAPRRDDQLSQAWARVFSPVMMLLLDRPDSPGLLVRPRPGRLELGGDHCDGERLASAVAFAAASARTVQRWSPQEVRRWTIDLALQPALDRYGWFVDRRAFGVDLYAKGCEASLRRAGRRVSAADHAAAIADIVRRDLIDIGGGSEDVAAFDRGMRDLADNTFFSTFFSTADCRA